jgi:hypothetical protein
MDTGDIRRQKTASTMDLAAEQALKLNVGHLLVASNTGDTALELLKSIKKAFPDGGAPKLVCVTHSIGFAGDGLDEMPPDMRKSLADEGFQILTTTHLFGGVERSMSKQWNGIYPLGMVASALKLFGQGAKVAVEIAVMALDSGLIPYGVDVITIGGSGRGADTALLIRPAHSIRFFDTKVKRVITLAE